MTTLSTSTGNAKKNLEKFNTQIIQFYQQGKTQEALTLSQQALTHFPNGVNLLANAGAFASKLTSFKFGSRILSKNIKIKSRPC